MKFRKIAVTAAALVAMALAGCATGEQQQRAGTGALLGAGAGAIAGQALGSNTKSTVVGAAVPAEVEPQKPAVPIKKSVTPDYIISLEDGRKFKSLKRHLMTSYGMTPDEYRAKWNLPSDYPMVAPSYSATRSELAKTIGLGRKPAEKPKGRGRKKKAA